jgi:hypothetical protein
MSHNLPSPNGNGDFVTAHLFDALKLLICL